MALWIEYLWNDRLIDPVEFIGSYQDAAEVAVYTLRGVGGTQARILDDAGNVMGIVPAQA